MKIKNAFWSIIIMWLFNTFVIFLNLAAKSDYHVLLVFILVYAMYFILYKLFDYI
jgi:hypothetical protein